MLDFLPSITAEAVCFARATDERRDSSVRIISDPYARHFLNATTRGLLRTWDLGGIDGGGSPLWGRLATYVRTRHRFIDDHLGRALADGRVHQLVILGAGYDSRAWRFADALGGKPVFELDFPSTGRRKNRIAATLDLPAVDRRVVTIDFQTQSIPERLAECGFEPGLPTFFVWEGVSMYLTRAAVTQTLQTLHELGGPGSELAMDLFMVDDRPNFAGTFHRGVGAALALIGEPVTFAIHPDDATALLERLGWGVHDLADADTLTQRYVRDGRRSYTTAYVLAARRA